eukprot:scaffold886_cov317-Prasinococcus_capsulatus_cf.AAC.20
MPNRSEDAADAGQSSSPGKLQKMTQADAFGLVLSTVREEPAKSDAFGSDRERLLNSVVRRPPEGLGQPASGAECAGCRLRRAMVCGGACAEYAVAAAHGALRLHVQHLRGVHRARDQPARVQARRCLRPVLRLPGLSQGARRASPGVAPCEPKGRVR